MWATASATGGSCSKGAISTTWSPGSTWCIPPFRTPDGARSCCARSSDSPPAPPGDRSPSDTGAPDASGSDAVAITRPLYLVYLAKQGTFYPFAPRGHEQRDNELELRLKSVVASDLPVENDLSRWFPIWDLPVA